MPIDVLRFASSIWQYRWVHVDAFVQCIVQADRTRRCSVLERVSHHLGILFRCSTRHAKNETIEKEWHDWDRIDQKMFSLSVYVSRSTKFNWSQFGCGYLSFYRIADDFSATPPFIVCVRLLWLCPFVLVYARGSNGYVRLSAIDYVRSFARRIILQFGRTIVGAPRDDVVHSNEKPKSHRILHKNTKKHSRIEVPEYTTLANADKTEKPHYIIINTQYTE